MCLIYKKIRINDLFILIKEIILNKIIFIKT